MRVLVAGLAILFVATCGSPVAVASGTPSLLIFHEIPDNVTYAGFPGQFGYIVLDGDERPVVHKQGKIRVVDQDGYVVYETEGLDAAHDYDGLNPFWLAFPSPRNYTVHVEVPYAGGVVLAADYPVTVLPPPALEHAKLRIGGVQKSGGLHEFTITVQGADDAVLEHSDVLLEIRRGSSLEFRAHLHSHKSPMTFLYRFDRVGEYLVRAVAYQAYPEPASYNFLPVSTVHTVTVAQVANDPERQVVVPPEASGGDRYRLLAAYDPAPSSSCPGSVCVTPFGNLRLTGFVYDSANKEAAEHVDFEARLMGADGIVFESSTLHEYDGQFELVVNRAIPGTYGLQLVARKGDWTGVVEMPFTVAPPIYNPTYAAGPLILKMAKPTWLEQAGAARFEFSLETLAGEPAKHSELDFQVIPLPRDAPKWGPPILQNKLHTHDSGTFSFDFQFPHGGPFRLVFDPETIHGEATPAYFFDRVGGELSTTIEVRPFIMIPPSEPFGIRVAEPALNIPGFGGSLVVVALALVAFMSLTRRRYP